MISMIVDLILIVVVISFCAAAIVGTIVYFLLKNKHDEDIGWLFKIICDNKTEVNRFYDKYADHVAEHHEQED